MLKFTVMHNKYKNKEFYVGVDIITPIQKTKVVDNQIIYELRHYLYDNNSIMNMKEIKHGIIVTDLEHNILKVDYTSKKAMSQAIVNNALKMIWSTV